MRKDRERWERRYKAGERPHDGPPSAILQRWLPRLPLGRALDLATGLGRNALVLAAAGYRVDAIDISSTCLEEAARRARRLGLAVRWIEADLDAYPIPEERYDVVVNAFFLKRGIFGALKAAVKPGGVVVVDTHLRSPEPDSGPPSPRHRLRRGELMRLFSGWEILDHQEGFFQERGRPRSLGRIAARKPGGRGPRRGATP